MSGSVPNPEIRRSSTLTLSLCGTRNKERMESETRVA